MRSALSTWAIAALIHFLTVSAAPVDSKAGQLQQRTASEISSDPPTVFHYSEYGPVNTKREDNPTLDIEKRGPLSPNVPDVTDYDHYGPPPPTIDKRGTDTRPDIQKRDPQISYFPYCNENGMCVVHYKDIQKRDGPTPLRYDPYAPPHCDGGLCDVHYDGGVGGGTPNPPTNIQKRD
ncbi:hypothetical protein V8E51_000158 [Hyaloscypha variabilis]